MRLKTWLILWLVAVAVSLGTPVGALAQSPLVIKDVDAVFAVSPPAGAPAGGGLEAARLREVESQVERLVTSLVREKVDEAVRRREVPSGARRGVNGLLAPLFAKLRDRAQGDAPRLDALVLAMRVSAAGLTNREALTMTLTFGGESYSLTIRPRRGSSARAADGVVPVLVRVVPLHEGHEGFEFETAGGLIRRRSNAVLFFGVLGDDIPPTLRALGAVGADRDGTPLQVPFGFSLTGSTSGTHEAASPSVSVLYFAKTGLLGIGVPEELAEPARNIVNRAADGSQ